MDDITLNILHLLCCPKCKCELFNKDHKLHCMCCNAVYENHNGIYRLLIDSMSYEVLPDDWDEYNWDLVEESRAKRRMKKVLKYIPKNGNHLDIGTGRGEGTLEVSKLKNTIGIDYGTRSLGIAKKYNLNLFQADGRHLPFKDDSFNSVTAMDVIEHIPHPEMFFDEVYRVLTNDGVLILQTPVVETEAIKDWAKKIRNKYRIIRKVDNLALSLRSRLFKANPDSTNAQIGSQPFDIFIKNDQLVSLITQSNFKIFKTKKVNYFVSSYFIQMFSYADIFLCKKIGNIDKKHPVK